VDCALLMLGALADEMNNLTGPWRKALTAATEAAWPQVAAAVQALVPAQRAAGGRKLGSPHGGTCCMLHAGGGGDLKELGRLVYGGR